MLIDFVEASEFLKNNDNFCIITHQSPDGDCTGSGFALHDILNRMGKKSVVVCSDTFPTRFDFLTNIPNECDFDIQTIVAVDIADIHLMGKYCEIYGESVQLSIDHHISNTNYAEKTLLAPDASAACELLYELAMFMGVEISEHAATCIYTGIATDTGCFKYDNTKARSHQIVAEIMNRYPNIPYAKINRQMFDIKSMGRIKMEHSVMDIIEYYEDNKITVISITSDLLQKMGVDGNDLDGCASLPLQIEGVEVGITIKEKTKNVYKVSMRSADMVNVSAICQTLGGGGHIKAAGCLLKGNLEEVKARLIEAVRKGM